MHGRDSSRVQGPSVKGSYNSPDKLVELFPGVQSGQVACPSTQRPRPTVLWARRRVSPQTEKGNRASMCRAWSCKRWVQSPTLEDCCSLPFTVTRLAPKEHRPGEPILPALKLPMLLLSPELTATKPWTTKPAKVLTVENCQNLVASRRPPWPMTARRRKARNLQSQTH